jgi:hypothetical protein
VTLEVDRYLDHSLLATRHRFDLSSSNFPYVPPTSSTLEAIGLASTQAGWAPVTDDWCQADNQIEVWLQAILELRSRATLLRCDRHDHILLWRER